MGFATTYVSYVEQGVELRQGDMQQQGRPRVFFQLTKIRPRRWTCIRNAYEKHRRHIYRHGCRKQGFGFSNGRIKSDAQSAAWTCKDGSSVTVELINELYVDSPKVSAVANSVYCWTVYVAGSKRGRIQRRPCDKKTDAFVCKAVEVKSDYC